MTLGVLDPQKHDRCNKVRDISDRGSVDTDPDLAFPFPLVCFIDDRAKWLGEGPFSRFPALVP